MISHADYCFDAALIADAFALSLSSPIAADDFAASFLSS